MMRLDVAVYLIFIDGYQGIKNPGVSGCGRLYTNPRNDSVSRRRAWIDPKSQFRVSDSSLTILQRLS